MLKQAPVCALGKVENKLTLLCFLLCIEKIQNIYSAVTRDVKKIRADYFTNHVALDHTRPKIDVIYSIFHCSIIYISTFLRLFIYQLSIYSKSDYLVTSFAIFGLHTNFNIDF